MKSSKLIEEEEEKEEKKTTNKDVCVIRCAPDPGDQALAISAATQHVNEGKLLYTRDVLEIAKNITKVENCPDSFYVINITNIAERLSFWRKCLPSVEPFYAVKTNNDHVILSVLVALGVGFDCASELEIENILKLGAKPENIIFAHPRKPRNYIRAAKEREVKTMVFDSIEELNKMISLFPDGDFVLRIGVDDCHSEIPLGGKFGATLDESRKIMDYAFERKVKIAGISFHVGSNCFSSISYEKAIEEADMLFKYAEEKWDIRMKILDIGGGWPGKFDKKFVEISRSVEESLAKYFLPRENVRIIAEPGRFFATQCMTTFMRVIGKTVRKSKKKTVEKEIAYHVADGAYGLYVNSLCFNYVTESILIEGYGDFLPVGREIEEDAPRYKSILWGPTCDSFDKILDGAMLPEMYTDEFMYSRFAGSYTVSLRTDFNSITPPRPYYCVCTKRED